MAFRPPASLGSGLFYIGMTQHMAIDHETWPITKFNPPGGGGDDGVGKY